MIPLGNKIENQSVLLRKAAELGLVGAHIPANYGGQEFDMIANAIISEELGGGSRSFSTTFGAHTGINVTHIIFWHRRAKAKILT